MMPTNDCSPKSKADYQTGLLDAVVMSKKNPYSKFLLGRAIAALGIGRKDPGSEDYWYCEGFNDEVERL